MIKKLTLVIALGWFCAAFASGPVPGLSWERTTPADAGFDASKLAVAQKFADKMESDGGMVVYDGKELMEWGHIKHEGEMHSVRKSFMSALIGIYSSDGKINLNSTLKELNIDDFDGLTDDEKQATVLDLLEARSGVYHSAAYETEGMKLNRPQRGSFAHGTHWYYNNWDFNTLGAIFEKCTGQKIADAFYNRIALPLGMQDFSKSDVSYFHEGTSVYPAYPFRMSARDMARFGLLYLREGRWGTKQIIPEAWIKESTTGHSSAGPGVDYGYLWWVAHGWMLGNKIDRPGYRADGFGGQYIIVLPIDKLIISHVSNFDRTKRDSIKPFKEFLGLLLDAKSRANSPHGLSAQN